MTARTLSWLKRSSPAAALARGTALRPHFRPTLDILEDRTVLSTTPLVNLPLDVGTITAVTNTVDGVSVQQLTAPVTIAGQQAGTLVMDVTTDPAAEGECPILNLEIQPISLNLLGLHVDTSAICLDLTGHEGEGLLGDLLCGLSGGLDLGGILGELDDVIGQVNTFLGGLEDLLDDVLGQAMTVTDVLGSPVDGGVTTQDAHLDGNCDILNLALGPINLELLGVEVALYNCDEPEEPITVDVTADADGGLLGSVLCGLADGDLLGLPVGRLVNRLDTLIDSVGRLADRLDEITQLPDRFETIANQLIAQLERVADNVDSLADLNRLISRTEQVVRRLDLLIENTDAPPYVTRQLSAAVPADPDRQPVRRPGIPGSRHLAAGGENELPPDPAVSRSRSPDVTEAATTPGRSVSPAFASICGVNRPDLWLSLLLHHQRHRGGADGPVAAVVLGGALEGQ